VTRATELWRRVRELSTLSRAAILLAVSLAVLGLTLPFAWQAGGDAAVTASLVAMLLCLGGAILALVFADVFGPVLPSGMAIYAGMLFRMSLPLVIGTLLYFKNPTLADAGLFGYLIVFYFVTLLAEVVLTLPKHGAMSTMVERK